MSSMKSVSKNKSGFFKITALFTALCFVLQQPAILYAASSQPFSILEETKQPEVPALNASLQSLSGENDPVQQAFSLFGFDQGPLSASDKEAQDDVSVASVSEPAGHSFAVLGNPQIQTGNQYKGGSALRFDGQDDALLLGGSEDWSFGKNDFTIDFRVQFEDVSSSKNTGLISQWDGATGERGWWVCVNPGAQELKFFFTDQAGVLRSHTVRWVPVLNQAYHIAVVRSGAELGFIVDGKKIGESYVIGDLGFADAAAGLSIGSVKTKSGYDLFLNGRMDEVRITKGEVLWAGIFGDTDVKRSEKTSLWLHFNKGEMTSRTEILTDVPALPAPEIKFPNGVYAETNDPNKYVLEVLVDGVLYKASGDQLKSMLLGGGDWKEGDNQILIVVNDGVRPEARATFTLHVVKAQASPVISFPNGAYAETKDPKNYVLEVLVDGVLYKASGDQLKSMLAGGGDWKEGDNEIVIVVNDGVRPEARATFTLHVVKAQAAPVISFPNGAYAETKDPNKYVLEVLVDGVLYKASGDQLKSMLLGGGDWKEGDNQIVVVVNDGVRPEAKATFTLHVLKKLTAPEIKFPNGAYAETNDPNKYVLEVLVDGVSYKASGDQLKAMLVGGGNWKEGDNKIVIVVNDGVRPEARATFTLHVNPIATSPVIEPPVMTSFPKITNKEHVVVSGTKLSGTSVWINGAESVVLDNKTVWQAVVDLTKEGSNEFTVVVKNSLRSESKVVVFQIELDLTAPEAPIPADFNVLQTNHTGETIYGYKEPGSAIIVNGSEIVASDDADFWSARVMLGLGNNVFSMSARDRAGNLSVPATITIERKNDAVFCEFSIGDYPSITKEAVLHIKGTKQQGSGIRVTGSAAAELLNIIEPNLSTTWEMDVLLLEEGLNKFEIVTTEQDINGNEVERRIPIEIVRDIFIPATPVAKAQVTATDAGSIVVTGTKEANTAIWINGQEVVPLNAATEWSAVAFLEEPGINTLTITAVDPGGNASIPTFLFITRTSPDPQKPVVINPPTYTNQPWITITGTKSPVTSIFINGREMVPINNDTTWTADIRFSTEGTNYFTIEAYPWLGLPSEPAILKIFYDKTPPEGSISIDHGSIRTHSDTVTLSLDAKDNNLEGGVVAMSFSTDGVTFSDTEPFTKEKIFYLEKTDAVNKIYVRYKDAAGNWSMPVSERIIQESTVIADLFTMISSPIVTAEDYTLVYALGNQVLSATTKLKPGGNFLSVSATDTAGKQYEKFFYVQYEINQDSAIYYDYDANGNVTRQTDATGLTTQFTYDTRNQLTEICYPDDSTVRFEYDANGNRTAVTDTSGRTEYQYDPLNRLTQVKDPQGRKVSYAYDLAGNIVGITYPNGKTVQYSYDAFNRMTRVTDEAGTTSYAYNGAGDVISRTLPNGIRTEYAYNQGGGISDIKEWEKSGELLSSIHYEYDAAGRRIRAEMVPDGVFGNTDYEYDALGRLIKTHTVIPNSIPSPQPGKFFDRDVTYQYAYDDAGNRTRETVVENGLKILDKFYSYDPSNRLTRIGDAQETSINDEFHYYDQRGNLVLKTKPGMTTYYTYDSANRLIGVDTGEHIIQYLYDADGNRTAKIVDGVRTDYVVDINRGIPQILQEFREGDSSTGRAYTYGNERLQVQDVHGNSGFYLRDALGSTTFLTGVEENDDLHAFYSYTPFGTDGLSSSMNNTMDNNFLFAGEQYDAETGLYYLRNRYYDPATGRFISKDPVIGTLDSTQSVNPYPYVQNDPVNKVDPLGLLSDGVQRALSIFDPGYGNCGGYYRDCSVSGRDGIDARDRAYGAHDRARNAAAQIQDPYLRERATQEADQQLARDLRGISGGSFYSQAYGWAAQTFIFNDVGKTYGTGYTPPSSRGGILLDKSAELIGENIGNITGAVYDPATGQFVLTGTKQDGVVSDVIFNDLVVALKAVFGSVEDPGVTIVQLFKNEAGQDRQAIQLFGGVENTEFGQVLIDADLVLKKLMMEKDNVTGNAINIDIAGYQSLLDRFNAAGHIPSFTRLWFVPDSMKLVRSEDGRAFQFEESTMKLLSEATVNGSVVPEPLLDDYARFITDNYEAFARIFPELERMRQLAKSVAIARFIKDNNIPIDLSWLDAYDLPEVTTPTSTPALTTTKGAFTITGGVIFELWNQYLSDPDGFAQNFAETVLNGKTGDNMIQWDTSIGDQMVSNVALSTAPSPQDNSVQWTDQDLSFPTPSEFSLELNRFYDSLDIQKSEFGYGWQFLPFELSFNRPAYVNSTYSNGITINGLREGEARFINRLTGEEIVFQSTLQASKQAFAGLDPATQLPQYAPVKNSNGSQLQVMADRTYALTTSDGAVISFDTKGNFVRLVDSKGQEFNYEYENGRLVRIRDFMNRTIHLTYNNEQQIVRVDGPLNYGVVYEYDSHGDLKSVFNEHSGQKTQYEYDTDHRLVKIIDPSGREILQAELDVMGRTTIKKDERGNVFEVTRSPDNRKVTTTDTVTGRQNVEEYDELHRLIRTTDFLGNTTSYQYLLFEEKPFAVIDPKGFKTYYTYDSNHNLTDIFDVENNVHQTFYYDSRNNVIVSTDRNGVKTQYVYDDNNNLVEIQRPTGDGRTSVVKFQYDGSGQITGYTDPNGNTHAITRDAFGNITQSVQSGAGAVEQNYDSFFRVNTVKDGVGREVQFEAFNSLDLPTSIQDAYGSMELTYDNLGRILSRKDDTGGYIKFVYDPDTGDLLSTIQKLADDRWIETEYTYDRYGNLTGITDPQGWVQSLKYDDLGRLLRVGEEKEYELTLKTAHILLNKEGEIVIDAQANKIVESMTLRYRRPNDDYFKTIQISDLLSNRYEFTLDLEPGGVCFYELEATDYNEETVSVGTSYFQLPHILSNLPQINVNRVWETGENFVTVDMSVQEGTYVGDVRVSFRAPSTGQTLEGNRTLNPGYINRVSYSDVFEPGTEYIYTLFVQNVVGNQVFTVTTDPIRFRTKDPSDHTAPQVLQNEIIRITATEAFLTLRTDETLGEVIVSIKEGGKNPVDLTYLMPQDERITISDLKPGTNYTYTLTLFDFSGNQIMTQSQSFVTPVFESTPARILRNDPINIGSNQATIRVETDEELSGVILTLIPKDTLVPQEFNFDVTSKGVQEFLLNGLKEGTDYEYTLTVIDKSGNQTTSLHTKQFHTGLLDL